MLFLLFSACTLIDDADLSGRLDADGDSFAASQFGNDGGGGSRLGVHRHFYRRPSRGHVRHPVHQNSKLRPSSNPTFAPAVSGN